MKSNAISLQLILNWDVRLVPVSSWTMVESGSKQIPVVAKKREITVVLAATASGTLLPPQVIQQA